jgi:hypothetical protein
MKFGFCILTHLTYSEHAPNPFVIKHTIEIIRGYLRGGRTIADDPNTSGMLLMF